MRGTRTKALNDASFASISDGIPGLLITRVKAMPDITRQPGMSRRVLHLLINLPDGGIQVQRRNIIRLVMEVCTVDGIGVIMRDSKGVTVRGGWTVDIMSTSLACGIG